MNDKLELGILISVTIIGGLLAHAMWKRNARGCCAMCGDTLDVYRSVTIGTAKYCARCRTIHRWVLGIVAVACAIGLGAFIYLGVA